MASNPITRRHLLAVTLLTCAGATLSPAVAFVAEEPAWLTDFSKRLEQLSVRMRRQNGEGGATEFHCEVRDAAAWGRSFAKLAAESGKVRAGGNVLTFSREGRSVRVVMAKVQTA